MKLRATPLAGVWIVDPEPIDDERGWFARTFDAEIFEQHGLDATVVQANTSFNVARGTLRGMHIQSEPHGEPKLVRCVRGAVYDVAVDLRPDSATYCGWHAVELRAGDGRGFYIPRGCAHGFQTLLEETEVHYLMGAPHVPGAATGVRWDDPAFGITWPDPGVPRTMSERDLGYPDFTP